MVGRGPTGRDLAAFRNFFRDFPDYGVRLTRHARERMAQRRIRLPQIKQALETGWIREVERDIGTGQDKFRVAGRDADGRELEVVVALGPGRRVTVVTAIQPRTPSRFRNFGATEP